MKFSPVRNASHVSIIPQSAAAACSLSAVAPSGRWASGPPALWQSRCGSRFRSSLDCVPARRSDYPCAGRCARDAQVGISLLICLHNATAYPFDDLRDDGVAETCNSVHAIGYPIIHSTNIGFSFPPMTAFRGKLFRRYCEGPPLFAESCTVGVGSFLCFAMCPKPL